MKKLLQLPSSQRSVARTPGGGRAGVVFAVYAPFGTDRVLSTWPGDQSRTIAQQPLVKALLEVARQGADVAALVDLHDDDTWLVEIPAFRPQSMLISSTWKQAMSTPQALAGFLRRVHQRFPCDSLVLALEGHGAGYLPDIDGQRITPKSTSDDGSTEWRIGGSGSAPFDSASGAPVLPTSGFPELPVESPEVTPITLPISTWGLASALASARRAGVPKPAVIHFNNCFNMALEHLHTVAPHAGVATGYANYNFFTAGAAYPRVFERLRQAGSASAEQLAQWFADANHAVLHAKGNHPTVGATIRLSRVNGLAAAVDTLALALVAALRPADPNDRPDALARIQAAVTGATQFDTDGNFDLEVPDQATDLGTLAGRLQSAFVAGAVHAAAVAVQNALVGVWQYGDFEHPHVDETKTWDFRDQRLGISILLPDPTLEGHWDWRSPYYMTGTVDPARPPALKHQIPFLADRKDGSRAPWALFIEEYHRDVTFRSLKRAQPPVFPIFDAKFKPKYPPPRDEPKDPICR
jgi:hypothetical protein